MISFDEPTKVLNFNVVKMYESFPLLVFGCSKMSFPTMRSRKYSPVLSILRLLYCLSHFDLQSN